MFSNVAVWFGLVKPTVSFGNCRTLCSSTAEDVDATPKPARVTVWVPALSVIVTAAVRAPAAPGLKETLKLHSDEAANVAEQLFPLIVKSDAFVPDAAMVMPVTDDVEVFVTCTS